jgi:signal transduction histidine kinase
MGIRVLKHKIVLSGFYFFLPLPAMAASSDATWVILPLLFLSIGIGVGYFLHTYLSDDHLVTEPEEIPEALLISAVDGGYYYHNIATGKEIISSRLRDLLGQTTAKSAQDLFAKGLESKSAQIFKSTLDDLRKGKNQVLFFVTTSDMKRQLECTASSTQDLAGGVRDIIIWFKDVTISQKNMSRFSRENEKLKSELKQLSTILNTLPLPVWLRNSDLVIRYCNLNYSQLTEDSLDKASDAEELELHKNAKVLAKVAFDSEEAKSERRHIVVNGQRKWYQLTEIPVANESVLIGVGQDISELEEAKEELERHVSAQKDLLESTASAVAVFGADTRLKYFNYAYVRLWGLDEPWLEASPAYSEILEVLREKRRLPEQANFPVFKQQQQRLFTDLIEPKEDIFYLPDGKTLRVLSIPHALGGILFSYEDVTDRLALERSFNTLTAVQRATLDNLHEGIVVYGEDGRLKLCNPVFLSMWGLADMPTVELHVGEVLEHTKNFYDHANWEQFKQDFSRQLHLRSIQRQRLERKDDKVFDAIWVPLPDGATLISYTDVTDSTLVERSLREKNEALQEADRLKSEFLANVSYELRSPLTSITGFSEMLKQDYFGELSPKQKEYVAGIYQSSHHLMQLINDILDIASIEAGYMRLDVKEFDIYAILNSVRTLIAQRLIEKEISLTFDCSPKIGPMLADETRVKQILFNLLSNAIKFSSRNGTIALGAEVTPKSDTDPEKVVLWVQDNGAGIDQEEQKAIFGKFYRKVKSGTGLGLSMVKSFVELHGGVVNLESRTGEGTRVTCTFPRFNQELLQYGMSKSKTPQSIH